MRFFKQTYIIVSLVLAGISTDAYATSRQTLIEFEKIEKVREEGASSLVYAGMITCCITGQCCPGLCVWGVAKGCLSYKYSDFQKIYQLLLSARLPDKKLIKSPWLANLAQTYIDRRFYNIPEIVENLTFPQKMKKQFAKCWGRIKCSSYVLMNERENRVGRELTFEEVLGVRRKIAELIKGIDDSGVLLDPAEGKWTLERISAELIDGAFEHYLDLPPIDDPRPADVARPLSPPDENV